MSKPQRICQLLSSVSAYVVKLYEGQRLPEVDGTADDEDELCAVEEDDLVVVLMALLLAEEAVVETRLDVEGCLEEELAALLRADEAADDRMELGILLLEEDEDFEPRSSLGASETRTAEITFALADG